MHRPVWREFKSRANSVQILFEPPSSYLQIQLSLSNHRLEWVSVTNSPLLPLFFFHNFGSYFLKTYFLTFCGKKQFSTIQVELQLNASCSWWLFVSIYAKKRHGEWLNDFLNLVSASKKLNNERNREWIKLKNLLTAGHHRLRDAFLRLRRLHSTSLALWVCLSAIYLSRMLHKRRHFGNSSQQWMPLLLTSFWHQYYFNSWRLKASFSVGVSLFCLGFLFSFQCRLPSSNGDPAFQAVTFLMR